MKKVTSILMAFVLMLTLIPTAWAEGESVKEWTAADSLPEYGTYKLMNDVTLTNPHVVTQKLDLDLGGHTVTGAGVIAVAVCGGGELTVDNGKLTSTGLKDDGTVIYIDCAGTNVPGDAKVVIGKGVTVDAPDSYGIACFGDNGTHKLSLVVKGTVTAKSAAVSGNGSWWGTDILIDDGAKLTSSDSVAIYHPQKGTLTIKAATITGKGGVEAKSGDPTVSVAGAMITATAAPSHGENNNGNSTEGYAVAVVENSNYQGAPTFTIKDGRFNGAVAVLKDNEVSANKQGTISITGGTFSSDPTAYLAAGYTASKGSDGMYTLVSNHVAQIGDTKYVTLADAVAVGGDIKLLKDTAEDITILAGKTITIDLNGKKITNKSADTITVEKGAALTINGTGIVDNVNHGKAAIYNKGAVTLNGGTFERSAEAGKDSNNNGGNSYYTILNHGEMTVGEGVTVNNKGHHSSLFSNGYYSYKTKDGVEKPTLTINGGMFDGGLNTIKNDDDGILTINNGTFKNYTQAAFQNHGTATVLNGSFIAESVYSIDNCGCDATHDPGKLTVSGGTFKGTLYVHSEYSDVAITGGSFTGSIVKTGGKLSITGGTFNTNPKDYVPAVGFTVAKKGDVYTVAEKDKNKDGTGETTSAVKLEVPATSGGAVINTTVDQNDIETNKELTVTNGKTAVTINQTGVNTIGAIDLKLDIKADSKTPESANTAAYNKAMAGKDANSAVVVNISLTNGASKLFTTDVTGAYALVTVPYSTDKADKLTVYYLNGSDATALTKVVDAADSGAAVNTFSYNAPNKLITLKLPHFSEYLISTTATRSVVHHYGGTGTTTTTGTKTNSPTTFDAGVGIYAVSAILSVTGMAWVGTKQRKH